MTYTIFTDNRLPRTIISGQFNYRSKPPNLTYWLIRYYLFLFRRDLITTFDANFKWGLKIMIYYHNNILFTVNSPGPDISEITRFDAIADNNLVLVTLSIPRKHNTNNTYIYVRFRVRTESFRGFRGPAMVSGGGVTNASGSINIYFYSVYITVGCARVPDLDSFLYGYDVYTNTFYRYRNIYSLLYNTRQDE